VRELDRTAATVRRDVEVPSLCKPKIGTAEDMEIFGARGRRFGGREDLWWRFGEPVTCVARYSRIGKGKAKDTTKLRPRLRTRMVMGEGYLRSLSGTPLRVGWPERAAPEKM
jgi:hypothetical protein